MSPENDIEPSSPRVATDSTSIPLPVRVCETFIPELSEDYYADLSVPDYV